MQKGCVIEKKLQLNYTEIKFILNYGSHLMTEEAIFASYQRSFFPQQMAYTGELPVCLVWLILLSTKVDQKCLVL